MTTIILTIIGILLAAAAALMVIFYGGNAFNGGSIGAQANTFQNAGTNVISAVELARANNATWTTVSSLHSTTDADSDYLKELPSLPNGDSGDFAQSGGSQYVAVVDGSNAEAVCARINKNLKVSASDPALGSDGTFTAVDTAHKMGCATTGTGTYSFFANA